MPLNLKDNELVKTLSSSRSTWLGIIKNSNNAKKFHLYEDWVMKDELDYLPQISYFNWRDGKNVDKDYF